MLTAMRTLLHAENDPRAGGDDTPSSSCDLCGSLLVSADGPAGAEFVSQDGWSQPFGSIAVEARLTGLVGPYWNAVLLHVEGR
ncbi:hypothetical protein GCM10010232_71070 [Streptomyces amakusaensis]